MRLFSCSFCQTLSPWSLNTESLIFNVKDRYLGFESRFAGLFVLVLFKACDPAVCAYYFLFHFERQTSPVISVPALACFPHLPLIYHQPTLFTYSFEFPVPFPDCRRSPSWVHQFPALKCLFLLFSTFLVIWFMDFCRLPAWFCLLCSNLTTCESGSVVKTFNMTNVIGQGKLQ